jgi:hypothetical protein
MLSWSTSESHANLSLLNIVVNNMNEPEKSSRVQKIKGVVVKANLKERVFLLRAFQTRFTDRLFELPGTETRFRTA